MPDKPPQTQKVSRYRLRKFVSRAEAQVRPAERVPAIFWTTDTELCVTSLQGTGLALLNLLPDGLRGINLSDYFRRQDPDVPFIAAHLRALEGESSSFEVVWSQRIFDAHVEPLRSLDGKVVGTIGVARELTERKRAEEALRRSEANYRSLVQGAPYGICRLSEDGKLLDANPAMVEMLGYSSEEELAAVNFDTKVFRNPQERQRILQSRPERIQGVEVAWKRKDGTPITVRLSGRQVRDPSGARVYYELIAENVSSMSPGSSSG